MKRWLLVLAFAAALAVGLTTMPQRGRADDPQWALFIWTELGWLRYVTPKGYISKAQSRFACEIDRASADNLRQGYRLECRLVK